MLPRLEIKEEMHKCEKQHVWETSACCSQESKTASIEIETAIKPMDSDILSLHLHLRRAFSVIFVVFVFAPRKIGSPHDGKTLFA